MLLLRIRIRIEHHDPALPVHCDTLVNRAVMSREAPAGTTTDDDAAKV